jgi:membrane associated rhomboid family serine protease
MVQRPPSLKRFLHFPVTGGITLLAVVFSSVPWYTKVNVTPLMMSYWAWHGQPWRLLTCTLLHANPVHLLFDAYWLLVFGAIVEEAFGSLFLLGLTVLLGAGSMAAEWAVSGGAIGLSGIAYGLFAFLWVLGRYTRRFDGVIDKMTAWVMVGWFFICIYLTAANISPVANVAHGAGALLGGLAGFMVAFRGLRRYAAGAALGATFALALACSSPLLRPVLNFSKTAGFEEFKLGYEALRAGHYDQAIKHLRESVAYRHADSASWFDLGLAYLRIGQNDLAADAFRHALAMQPDSISYRTALKLVQNP